MRWKTNVYLKINKYQKIKPKEKCIFLRPFKQSEPEEQMHS